VNRGGDSSELKFTVTDTQLEFRRKVRSGYSNPLCSPKVPRSGLSAEEQILPARRCTKRILLAEDRGINQQVTLLLLEKMGHHVDVLADGEQPVMAVDRDIYDLVLMDCQRRARRPLAIFRGGSGRLCEQTNFYRPSSGRD
jgi:hypothetical protein